MGPYAIAARLWLAAGWSPVTIPYRRKKAPPSGYTGEDGVDVDAAQVDLWCMPSVGRRNIAIHLPVNAAAVDVDAYGDKHGAESFAELEAKCGPLPPTWRSTSRGFDDVSGIRWFRIPPGVKLQGKPAPGIEIVQHHHRYVMVGPSLHPENREYAMFDPDGNDVTMHPPTLEGLPMFPDAWLAELAEAAPSTNGTRTKKQRTGPTAKWELRVTLKYGEISSEIDSGACRHDTVRDGVLALKRFVHDGDEGADAAIEMLGERFKKAITADGSRTPKEAAKEWDDIVEGARNIIGEPQEQPKRYEPTELGSARRLVDQHGEDLMYVANIGWHAWDGRLWKRDITGEVNRRVKQVVDGLLDEYRAEFDESRKGPLFKHYRDAQKAGAQNGIIKLAQTEIVVVATADQLDTDPMLLNVGNGTFDLRTGQLRDHRRADRITKLAPVGYDERATCPLWDKFLRWKCRDDEALVQYLQALVGISLTGDVSAQILPFLYGDGENGKSTFTGILEDLLGLGLDGYAAHAAKTLLVMGRHQEHPTVIADLVGRRLVVCTEVDEEDHFDEVLVKQLTGGDTIKGRFMRQDYFSFQPTGSLWLAGNHRPHVRGTDYAIWRRIKLIPCEAIVAPGERDDRLRDKLRAELPGILAWAVRGCLDWQKNGLTEPLVVTIATAGYRSSENFAERFLDACCEISPEHVVESTELYEAYTPWAIANHAPRLTQKALAPLLESAGYESKRHSRTRRLEWQGIRLRNDAKRSAV